MGDGKKVFILIAFAATSMTMVAEAMFYCSGSVADLPCAPDLLEETWTTFVMQQNKKSLSSLQIHVRHFKDPLLPWRTPKELSDHCRYSVTDLGLGETPPTSSPFSFARSIHWQPPLECIVLVEIFWGIGAHSFGDS